MNVSEYIFEFFNKKGVEAVFMVTGGQAMYLDDAVGKNKNYSIICHHHEQACTMSADAYGRIKNNERSSGCLYRFISNDSYFWTGQSFFCPI